MKVQSDFNFHINHLVVLPQVNITTGGQCNNKPCGGTLTIVVFAWLCWSLVFYVHGTHTCPPR